MTKRETFDFVAEQQRQWASSRGIAVNPTGRVQRLDDNLFAPMCSETHAEFAAGDGGEFGTPDDVGKMYSLWSSSALVYNVFDYWRGRGLTPLLHACGSSNEYTELKFEQKYPTGVRSARANVDVVLSSKTRHRAPLAVESKFTEPYQYGKKECLSPSYFLKPETWRGLQSCRCVAEALAGAGSFEYLDAAQLLKHILGLTRRFGRRRFLLVYLWYTVENSDAAKKHRDEVTRFADAVRPEVLFESITYQDFYRRLRPEVIGTPYEEYMTSRYFYAPEADDSTAAPESTSTNRPRLSV